MFPKKAWPKYLRQFPELRFISVGACRYSWEWNDSNGIKELAHAHSSRARRDRAFFGTICLRKASLLDCRDLMIHEVCHLLEGADNHDDKWRQWVLAYGGTLSPFRIGCSWSCNYNENGDYPKE